MIATNPLEPMTRIVSAQNPRLKELRRLSSRRGRDRAGRFFAEGEDLVAAARSAGWEAVEGYRSADAPTAEMGFVEVDGPALAALSTLGSGTRVVGVYEQRWTQAPDGPLCVYLHGLSDPGNVGTVLRSALAFGASSVALGAGCADPYSPKAVRASMGAVFAVALARVRSILELPGERIALVAHRGEPLQALAATRRERRAPGSAALSLLLGAERSGLPEQVLEQCDRIAHIPIACDSLNAAMAATIALHEMTRVPTS
jgi:RNA methyltransferase, TrmH family